MKRIFLLMAVVAVSLSSFGRVICDTACHAPEDESRNYAVVSPVGRSMVKHIEQAPRLTTLDNKTIAIVGVSFVAQYMGHIRNTEDGKNTPTPPWYDRTERPSKLQTELKLNCKQN